MLFDGDPSNGGLPPIDPAKVLAATGGALSGAAGALAPQQEPTTDWTIIAMVGLVGLGVVLLVANSSKR